ncbi:MAG: carboxypeptidase-like regulatory domain-containing protein, partial [Acidobacteriota bacterium]
GLHQVVVKAAGFYQTGLNPMFTQRAFGMGMGNKAPENAPEVTTADGGPDQRLDVALKTGAIAVGTVLTPENEPVAGARVTVAAKPNPSMMFMPGSPKPRGPTGITDEQGNFRLIGLEAGSTVKFEAEADDWVVGESEPVSLAAGQETAGIVVKLRRGGFITGRITSYQGGPLAGVEIRTLAQPSNATGNPWQWELQLSSKEPALTDEQGRFHVSDLAPGPWILRASAPGHRVVTKLGIAVLEGSDGGPIDLKLEKGLQITGVVVDADGKAIPGVNLRASAATGAGPGRTAVRNATTDEKGVFTLDQFEPGQYSITISTKGYASRSHAPVDAGTRDLRIVLEKGLSISGRVLMPDGGPATNIWVSTRSETGKHEVDQTGEDGTFQIENLPEGLYLVHASNGGAFRFGGGKDEGSSMMPATREGVPAGTTNLELRLQAGATIEGRVTDENGDPIQRVSVFARTIGESQTRNELGTTDESGEFRITGLAPGTRVLLSVSHGDYGPLPGEEVNADATGLTFVLPPKPERPDDVEDPNQLPPR